VSSQGFFSFGDNFDEQISGRFAGEKDNTIARVDGPSTPIGSEYGLGSLNINRGATFPVNIRPKKGFTLDDVYGIKKSFVSPRGNEVGQIASATKDLSGMLASSGDFNDEAFNNFVDKNYTREVYDSLPNYMKYDARQQFKEQEGFKYKEGSLLNRAKPKEEKGNILQRIAGSIFDAATGTQPAAADVLDGKIDFGSAVRGIGNLPSDYKATEAAAFRAAEKFRDTASGMSNLPSNYKATEAAAFRAASNFKEAQSIAKRNPNVSINSDGKAVATNNSARARAQASAVNRKLSGKSISQTKSENKKSMRDAARKRHAAFKKKRAQKKNKKN